MKNIVDRNWFDCGRCGPFHDQYWQHLDTVSKCMNIFVMLNSSIIQRAGSVKASKIDNLNNRELRAPMVQSMRAIGPRDPDLVVNALVDYPVIWNWLLTAVEIDLNYK